MQFFKGFADSQLIMSRALIDDVQQCDFFLLPPTFLGAHFCYITLVFRFLSFPIFRLVFFGHYASVVSSRQCYLASREKEIFPCTSTYLVNRRLKFCSLRW